MKIFNDRICAPTPNPRPGGGYNLLAALAGYGALRNRISLKVTGA